MVLWRHIDLQGERGDDNHYMLLFALCLGLVLVIFTSVLQDISKPDFYLLPCGTMDIFLHVIWETNHICLWKLKINSLKLDANRKASQAIGL